MGVLGCAGDRGRTAGQVTIFEPGAGLITQRQQKLLEELRHG